MNGQAGECYWAVRYRREGDPLWILDTLSGKFPIQAEAEAHRTVLLDELDNDIDQGFTHEAVTQRFCCGQTLPGE